MKKHAIYATLKAAAISLAALTAACSAYPANTFAATKIKSVSITFTTDGFDEDGNPVVEAETNGNHYTIGNTMLASDYYADDTSAAQYEGDTQTWVVELAADDDYYFYITKSEKIRLNGAGAEFVKASRKDSGTTLAVTAKLTRMEEFVGEVGDASWTGDGIGKWDAAVNAKFYRVTLVDPSGKSKTAETGGTTYDFKPFMQRSGDYSFQVRPVSMNGKKGDNVSGGGFSVTDEQAEANKERYKVQYQLIFDGEEKTPDNCERVFLNTGWQQDDDGSYWYRNEDGSYIQTNWLQSGEDWYFFGADGKMLTSSYVSWGTKDYYFGNDGKMARSGLAPDGRAIGADGTIEGITKYSEKIDYSQSGPGVAKKTHETESGT